MTFVVESLKRRWWVIIVIAIVAGMLGLASMLTAQNVTGLQTYTAEASVYVNGHESSEVNAYNYNLNEEFVVGDTQRFVLNDSVAGEVRRTFGEEVVIEVPLWQNPLTKLEAKTHFVFIDATAPDEEAALAAANMAADLVVEKIEAEVPGMKASVSDRAAIKTSSSAVADFGTDPLTLSPVEQVASSVSVKKLVVFVLVGLIVGAAFVLIVDYCRRRVRSMHDVERLMGVNVIDSLTANGEVGVEDVTRCAGIIDALSKRAGRVSVCLCGWQLAETPSGIVNALNAAMRQAKVVGWAGLESASCNTRAFADADCIVLVVAKGEQKSTEIDDMLRCVSALGMDVLGALYIENGVRK